MDELLKGIAFDGGKAIPVSYLLALFQSLVPFPKAANSDPPVAQPVPQPGVPSPQNPTGGYYPGAPINQEAPVQQQVTPQSYYDPRTNPQVSYQDPRLQDPRYLAALQLQAQQIASTAGQQPYQDSQPVPAFGRTEADLSQMTPQGNWFSQSQRWVCCRTNPPLWISANALQTTLGEKIKFEILRATPQNLNSSISSRTVSPLHPNVGYPIDRPFCFSGGASLIFPRRGRGRGGKIWKGVQTTDGPLGCPFFIISMSINHNTLPTRQTRYAFPCHGYDSRLLFVHVRQMTIVKIDLIEKQIYLSWILSLNLFLILDTHTLNLITNRWL